MPSGGARSRSGPPPDPEALRRDRASDKAGWITLPAEGRKGRPPAWPLTKATARERTLWNRQWKKPQAVQWEISGQEEEVALYVRSLVIAESPFGKAADRTLVRQFMDSLGISVTGLQRNRWRIAETPVAAAKSQHGPKRAGLHVVKGGAG